MHQGARLQQGLPLGLLGPAGAGCLCVWLPAGAAAATARAGRCVFLEIDTSRPRPADAYQFRYCSVSLPNRVDPLHSGSMQRPLYSFLSNCVDRRPPGWACTTAQQESKQQRAAGNCLCERIARSSLIVWHVAFIHKRPEHDVL